MREKNNKLRAALKICEKSIKMGISTIFLTNALQIEEGKHIQGMNLKDKVRVDFFRYFVHAKLALMQS